MERCSSGTTRLFSFNEETLLKFDKLWVVGDIHGNYSTLNLILDMVDPSKQGLVFLGDYADRGGEGVEVIEAVGLLIKKYPRNVVGLKGNHEDYSDFGRPSFSPCHLIEEARRKKGDWRVYFENEFKPFVSSLYLSAIIPGEILFVHGGVSSKITSTLDLRHPTKEVERDILWSDPFPGSGESPNIRGAGIVFGEDVTAEVCKRIGVKRIVRSHEPRKALEGPHIDHGGRVITISSTNVYGGNPFILEIDPEEPKSFTWNNL